MPDRIDKFFLFIDDYDQGNALKALQSILSSPDVRYDDRVSNEPAFRHLVNFADACVYETFEIATEAYQALCFVIKQDKRLSVVLTEFLELLKIEKQFVELFAYADYISQTKLNESEIAKAFRLLNEENFLLKEAIDCFSNDFVPLPYKETVDKKIHIVNERNFLIKKKPYLDSILSEKRAFFQSIPWHIFSYPSSAFPGDMPPVADLNKTPLLFLEPIDDFNYREFFLPYKNRKCIAIVDTVVNFLQLLQFSDISHTLAEEDHYIYILELYPSQQIFLQGMHHSGIKNFEPIFMISRKAVTERISLFMQVLMQCIEQKDVELMSDTPISDWLYKLAQRIILDILGERYGKSRSVGLNFKENYRLWFDPHKGLPPSQADLGPDPKNYLGEILNETSKNRFKRPFIPKKKLRLAHVVPQVASFNQAPTKLMVNLLRFADSSWFDLFLISTERVMLHLLDYPFPAYGIESSTVRGAQVLEYLNALGVAIHVEPKHLTYEKTAERLTKLLKDIEIDVVVFHGPDPVNLLISSSTDVPFRVLFEHGTLTDYPCFDLAILSNEESYSEHRKEYKKFGMESCFLNYSINAKEKWTGYPYSKEALGFPKDSFIMTTVSNHLENRLSNEMCHAIGEILSRYPHVFYAPMGKISGRERIDKIFEKYGVSDRVKFLGFQSNPAQLLRSMDLYLNEFPFGSGLVIIEAMAAGCPVVSMYDEYGVAQAKYGGIYFGKERVIKTGDKEEYIDLACRLIEDCSLYEEWSNHAKEQYVKRGDERAYVKAFENLLSDFIHFRR